MINEKNKTVEEDSWESVTTVNVDDSDCQAKMEKLNKKLQETANELEEISSLYAKSVKESLDKSKKNKELEDKIDESEEQLKACREKNKKLEGLEDKVKKLEEDLKECRAKREDLENQLKECKAKREELEAQLKDCQEKNKKSDESKRQWIPGEYKWMPVGSKMPEGWVKVDLAKGLTIVQSDKEGKTLGSVGKHNHTFLNNAQVWTTPASARIAFINERTSGSLGSKYVPFLGSYTHLWGSKTTADTGKGISNTENNLAAGIFAELWQYQGENSSS
ncbi:hypothetical protein [Spiroplasma endosymbiont of Nomada rufipes]